MAASTAQISYVTKLLDMKVVPGTLRRRAESVIDGREAGWRVVSAVIDDLKACPWVPRDGARTPASLPVLEAGTYAHGDVIFRVQVSKTSGKPYAKVWDGSGWEYDARAYRDHAAYAEIVPLARAIEIGCATGHCVCCARDLRDPVSIEAGIGPVCVKRYGTTREDIIAGRRAAPVLAMA